MQDEDIRTVTKRELVNRIAEETGQTKVVVRDVLQRFLDSVIDELAEGNRLEFRDFGVFEVRERAARVAQNPRTLEKVPVPAKRVVKFKVGRVMRQRVCEELQAAGSSDSLPRPASGAQMGGTGANGRSANTAAGASGGAGVAAGGSAGSIGDGGADYGSSNGRHNGDGAQEDAAADAARAVPPTPPPPKPGSPF